MNEPRPSTSGALPKDDALIREKLGEAHIPSLAVTLVHLTGDMSHLRAGETPTYDFWGDGQGELSENYQQQIRDKTLSALIDVRDKGVTPRSDFTAEQIVEMMSYVAGDEVPEHYVPFLLEELALDNKDHKQTNWKADPTTIKEINFSVAIIGAGMSGLLAGIRLKQAGIPFDIFEKNEDVGGTWFENVYPGCRVDTPNHMYSYSFDPFHDWPHHYSTQETLLHYFQRCAEEYGLKDHIRFNTHVNEMTYNDQDGTWTLQIETQGGANESVSASAVITAVGQLNQPKFPDIPGQDKFSGPSFHSAKWDHGVDLAGKRVAVIGTGASAFQFVPEIAGDVAEMHVFQRSAPWLGPAENYHHEVPDGMKWLLNHVPYYAKWYRFWLFWTMTDGVLPAATADDNWQGSPLSIGEASEELRLLLTEYIRGQAPDDPDLADKVVPDYPPAGKRMLRDNGLWIGALKRDNVHLITDSVAEITSTGVKLENGNDIEVDVIIYGTGFHASRFLSSINVTGRNGAALYTKGEDDLHAYLGITVPNFPNLFLLYGPNTNIVVNGSIIFFSECEMRYITGCLKLMLEGRHREMECKSDVCTDFIAEVDAGNAKMAWGQRGLDSWYKNSQGRVTQNWPFKLVDYWERTREPNPEDFVLGNE